MQHTFLLTEGIGHRANRTRFAPQHNGFSTQIVAQVDVGGSEYDVVVVVLHIVEFTRELSLVVVVDQRDGAQGFLIFFPFLLHQVLAQQITKEFGAILIAAFIGKAFELLMQVAVEGEAGADEVGHGGVRYGCSTQRKQGGCGPSSYD